MEEFHRHEVLPRGTNSSFIALVAKCGNLQNLGQFKPIFLMGCVYKILAKLIANRMRKVLGKIIDHY